MEKYLIINADDYGSFLGANLAAQDLLVRGCITSSTVMIPCPWAKHACAWAAAHPEYAVGVHLTTTSEWSAYRWGPVAPNGTDSLRDEEGYFWRESDLFEKHADIDETEREIRAQLARAKRFGLNPSHWDNHMGSLYGIATGRFEMLQMIFTLSAEYALPFRFPIEGVAGQMDNAMLDIQIPKETLQALFGQLQAYARGLKLITPDYLIPHDYNGSQKESYAAFREYMFGFAEAFPHGVTETYLHPSLDTGEACAASGAGIRRTWEYDVYRDDAFQKHLRQLGIQKISYRDLAAMR
ncbi:MAG: polysaccharide deacetylase family protein [Oscillospiraceae bacterium]|jgi:predicted glycoside hydrolase/deacetylase ChbG (UPF0249 family)|nr:polysaccharide deacetylase family protein [Oscillospiraceae bacterium]